MILVVGATGFLGSTICQQLSAEGRRVRAVVRPTSDPATVSALREKGAELVEADLKDRASLDQACQGVDTVISTVTTTLRDQNRDPIAAVDHQGQLQLVDAAQQAGVRRFVYISYPRSIDGAVPPPLSQAKRAVEDRLQASPMTYTVLQPGVFLEVWMSPILGFDYPNAKVQVLGDGNQSVGWISLADVARYTVASLNHPVAQNAVLPLVAENLSFNAAVRLFEEQTGRTFEVQHVPLEALQAQRAAATTPLEESFAALMTAIASGAAITPDPRQAQLGVTPIAVRDYVQRVTAPAVTA